MPGAGNVGRIYAEFDINLAPAFAKLRTSGKAFVDAFKKNIGTALKTNFVRVFRGSAAAVSKELEKTSQDWRSHFHWLETGLPLQIETRPAQKHLKGFLYWTRSLSAKIQHYLTFTIGVQIVMRTIWALQSAIETISEFSRVTTEATSVAGYFGAAFDDTRKHIEGMARDLAKLSTFTATEVAEALYSVASAGYDLTKISKQELLPILHFAMAAQVDLNYATEMVLKTMKSFGLTFEDTSRIVDIFMGAITKSFLRAERLSEGLKYCGQMAGALGIPLTEVTAALATLVDRGYEGSQAGQRLNMIFTKLLKPTREAEKALDSLGLSIADLDPKTHSLVEILYKLRAAGFGAAEASAMFRARTAAAALTLVENADQVAYLSEELKSVTGLTENLARKTMESFYGALRKLTIAIHDFYISLGEFLVPVVTTIADAIRSYLLPALKTLLSPIVAFTQGLSGLPNVGTAVTGVLFTLGTALVAVYAQFRLLAAFIPSFAQSLIASAQAMGYASNFAFSFMLNLKSLLIAAIPVTATMTILSTAFRDLPLHVKAAATALSFLASAALLLRGAFIKLMAAIGPIGWIITGIGIAASFFADKIAGAIRGFAEAIGLAETREQKFLRVVSKSAAQAKEVANAWKEAAWARARYEKTKEVWEEALRSGEASIDLYEELGKARAEWTEKEEVAIRKTNEFFNSLAKASPNLDKYIKLAKERLELDIKLSHLDTRLAEIQEQKRKAQEEYNEAVELYGIESEEAASALERLKSLGEEETGLLQERADLTEDLKAKNEELTKSFNDMYEVEKSAAGMVDNLIDLLGEYYKAKARLAELEAKANALRMVAVKYDKILQNKLAKLAETEEKVLDLEERLYKLRKSFVDKTRELWEALTKEGIVTDEMIEGRKELEIAYGKMMKAQVQFSSVLNKLLPEQRDQVTDFIEAYIAAREAGAAVPPLPTFLSPEDAQIVLSYAEAVWEYQKATQDLYSVIGPLTGDLIENQLASGEVASAYYELIGLNAELRSEEQKRGEALAALNETTASVAETIWQLWQALQDESTATMSTAEKFALLCNKLGIFQEAGGNTQKLLEGIRTVLGDTSLTWETVTEKQLITAATVEYLNERYWGLSTVISALPLGPLAENLSIVSSVTQGVDKAASEWTETLGDLSIKIDETKSYLWLMFLKLETLTYQMDYLTRAVAQSYDPWYQLRVAMWGTYDVFNNLFWAFSVAANWFQVGLPAAIGTAISSFWNLWSTVSTVSSMIINTLSNIASRAWATISSIRLSWSFFQKGGLVRGPTLALLGEKGPELVLPLYDPRRTAALLARYLPGHIPAAQYGMLATPAPVYTYTTEEYNIMGPIIVQGVTNVEEFAQELKFQARAAAP